MRKDDLVDYDGDSGICRTTPRQVFVELSPRCNLACVHCSKDYGLRHDGDRDMALGTLQALEPWLLQARSVNLNLVGEPLLARHFNDALELCARGNADVAFNTNGLGLTDSVCDRIVAAGVESVVVSIDGMESNQPIRGIPYAVLKERLQNLHSAKLRAGSRRPLLGIAFTLMRRTLHELPRLLADLLPAVPLDRIHLQPLIVFYETLREQNIYRQVEVDEVVGRARTLAVAHGATLTLFRSRLQGDESDGHDGERLQLGQRSRRFGCSDPFYEVKILADGTVQSCSWGLAGGFNVNTAPLDAIWNSAWYRRLRRRLASHEFTETCRGCPYVFGSAANQETALRHGVEHSQAARFFSGAVGLPRSAPEPVARPFLTGRPARPEHALWAADDPPPRS